MKKQNGVTLIELMIAIAVLAVLLGIGIPSFQDTIRTNRVAAITNDLVGALQFARSEAVRRGEDVTVCSSNDQATCSGTWSDGWVVRTATTTLRVWPALRAGANVVPTPAGTIVYGPMGNAAVARCFDITFDTAARNVDINAGGRVQSNQGACS